MADNIMLLCSYGGENVAVVVHTGYTFCMLVEHVCQRFGGLHTDSALMSFKIPGYNNFKMENDSDFENMVCLARSFGLDHVDVDVVQRGASRGIKRRNEVNDVVDDIVTQGGEMAAYIHEGADLLPNFCQHTRKVLLSADWVYGITNIGQCFEGGAGEFRKVLSKYAIECGFQFKFVKNDLVRITAECTFKESRGCPWFIHARVLNANGYFYIKKWHREHTCGVAVRTDRNPRMGSELVADVIAERVHDKPLTRPTDVKYDFKKEYGLQISYRVAWLGVEKARGELYGDHSMSFDQLRWYTNAVMEYNPGSYINLEFDEHNTCRFNRLFISFKACIDGFNQCRPLLFLDGTFLKGRFKDNLLAATAKDGNQGLFPVAFAIVDSENAANWSWFLQNLANVVDENRVLTFVSDRHVGIMESMPNVFPTAHHAFCMQHLQRNLKDKMKYVNKLYRVGMVSKFRACAYAPTVTDFNEKIDAFIQSGRHIAMNFLTDLEPHRWANAYFKCGAIIISSFFYTTLHSIRFVISLLRHTHFDHPYICRGKRYGEMCSNAAESFNNWIKEARNLPITRLVDAIRTQIMTQMSERRGLSSTWACAICPAMESKLDKAYKEGRSWIVSQSNNDVYEVHSHPSVLVDIAKRTCSCFQWQINGFPCEHAVVAIRNSGSDLNALVEPYFHVSTYQLSYSHTIYPIPTIEKPHANPENYVILPPVVRRPPGRPKKKRIPSKGEEVQQIRCGRCGRLGNHNRKTCNEPI